MAKSTTRFTVTLGDESYIFDRNELDLNDLFAIKSASGLDFNAFLNGVPVGDPVALQTLVWFLRMKNGKPGDRMQVMFKVGDFDIQPVDEDADPTAASSGSSDVATSDDSPTT